MEPPKPLFPDREFFSMGEAARLVQLPEYTLRYWESKLGQLRPARRQSGHRRYTKKDLETILRVKDLLRDGHMTLAGARKALVRSARAGSRPGAPDGAPPPQATDAALLKLVRELRADLKDLLSEMSR